MTTHLLTLTHTGKHCRSYTPAYGAATKHHLISLMHDKSGANHGQVRPAIRTAMGSMSARLTGQTSRLAHLLLLLPLDVPATQAAQKIGLKSRQGLMRLLD